MFSAPEKWRLTTGAFGTRPGSGPNGAFIVQHAGHKLQVIASDGGGWEHVSLSIPGAKRTPTWEQMTFIASLFWDDDDVLLQYRPGAKDYVNCHPYTLHWWRPVGVAVPQPDTIMVGPMA